MFFRKPYPAAQKFLENKEGHLVPVNSIPSHVLIEDRVVGELAKELERLAVEVERVKRQSFERLEKMFMEMGTAFPENKYLHSFDGKYRIILSVYKHKIFNENMKNAYRLMSGYIERNKLEAKRRGIDISGLWEIAKQRINYEEMTSHDKQQIMKLQSIEIDDEDWKRAVELMKESVDIDRERRRLNIYRRDEFGNYRLLQINFYRVDV